jgi:hypothetical protein
MTDPILNSLLFTFPAVYVFVTQVFVLASNFSRAFVTVRLAALERPQIKLLYLQVISAGVLLQCVWQVLKATNQVFLLASNFSRGFVSVRLAGPEGHKSSFCTCKEFQQGLCYSSLAGLERSQIKLWYLQVISTGLCDSTSGRS